jgi:hypothetical protein
LVTAELPICSCSSNQAACHDAAYSGNASSPAWRAGMPVKQCLIFTVAEATAKSRSRASMSHFRGSWAAAAPASGHARASSEPVTRGCPQDLRSASVLVKTELLHPISRFYAGGREYRGLTVLFFQRAVKRRPLRLDLVLETPELSGHYFDIQGRPYMRCSV